MRTRLKWSGAEAGLSRIFAGVHTRIDHKAGLDLGRDVAGFVLRSSRKSDFGAETHPLPPVAPASTGGY